MKKILTTCATATTKIGVFFERNNRVIVAASIICLVSGLVLSHRIEPGVRVQKVTLAEETPALKFSPVGLGPHPVALLAHGYASSKEAFFRYGEALAAAGFVCYSVDQPGHGASPRPFTLMEAAHVLEAVAREVGPVDVFAGWSMGGFTGGEAVREGGMKPGLFIAVGSMPVLGDHAPPLLLLAGQFEEALTPDLLKTRTDARLVISPWSDHFLEGFDPVLVNAAVKAACSVVHKTPPTPPTAWRWRLVGAVLAMLAATGLASCLTNVFSKLARFRGVLIGVCIAAAFMLTIGGRWLEATPHLRLQVIALPVILLLAIIVGKLRIPRWSLVALCVVVTAIAVCWFMASPSRPALILMASTVVLTPALIAGVVIGWFASRRGSRLQGDIAMAIFLGCVPFQCLELPRTAPEALTPHVAIKLNAKLLDSCVGEYEFPPDNACWLKWKMTIRRQRDQLVEQITMKNKSYPAVEIYPESETNFFVTAKDPHELTFVKNDKGEVTTVIVRFPGIAMREGKKLNTAAPVAVPVASPKAVSFYHSIILLITVLILSNLLIPVVFLFTGFSAKLRWWAERLGRRWYFSYAIYFIAFSLIYFLLLLPLAYYGGFILLHHYDLSNQSFVRWLSNAAKGAAIVLVGGLAVGWIPFFIIKKSPRRWWLYLGLLTPLYLCFTLWIQPVLIAPLFNKFTPLQDKELEAKILAEATRAGIQGSRVYQVNSSVDSKVENAYVSGLMGTQRIVLYDTLLQNMNEDELLFVMGHEMGHYLLRHRPKRIAFESILILVSLYLAYLLAGQVIGRFKNIWGFATPSDFAAMPLGVLAFWLFCFVDRPIDLAFSRYREHEADRFGLELTHKNHAAATCFVKLTQVGLGVPRPGAIFTIWFDSHPCVADRIEFCNTYHPWETGRPSRYERYFLPAPGAP